VGDGQLLRDDENVHAMPLNFAPDADKKSLSGKFDTAPTEIEASIIYQFGRN
jgi:hypothetical protein